MTIERGDPAPDITLPDQDETNRTLADLAGRPVVLFFYPKDNTPGCTIEAKDFTTLLPDFESAGAEVFGISPDSAKSHRNFRTKQDLSITLLADADKQAAEAFGVWKEKSMFGRKYMGIERSTFLIDTDGRVAEAWRKVKVPGHAEAVLAAVRALPKA